MITKRKTGSKETIKRGGTVAESKDAELRRLKRENKKLRKTIDDVWGVLNIVDATASPNEMYAGIDLACNYIMDDLPDVYYYDEDTATSEPTVAMMESAKKRTNKKIAEELGVSESEISGVGVESFMTACRKVVAAQFGLEKVPDGVMSPENYEARVAYNFVLMFLYAAQSPYSPKDEAQRYIDAMKRLKAGMPKKTRQPGADVQLALDMIKTGHTMYAIFPAAIKNYGSLSPHAKREARKKLRGRVSSLRRTRARRAGVKK
jgi:hypothetical protein